MPASWFISGPNGERLVINEMVFKALAAFIKDGEKQTGSATIHFVGGAIWKAESVFKKQYENTKS